MSPIRPILYKSRLNRNKSQPQTYYVLFNRCTFDTYHFNWKRVFILKVKSCNIQNYRYPIEYIDNNLTKFKNNQHI